MLSRTRQTRIQLQLPNLGPQNYLQFLLIFNIVLGGEGEQ